MARCFRSSSSSSESSSSESSRLGDVILRVSAATDVDRPVGSARSVPCGDAVSVWLCMSCVSQTSAITLPRAVVFHMPGPHASYSIMYSYMHIHVHIQSQFSLKLMFVKFTVVACSSKHCRCNSRRLLLAILLTDSVKYRTPVGRKQNRNRIYLCYM